MSTVISDYPRSLNTHPDHRTILFAGHDTSSNTIGLVLLEMARKPSIQTRLRREVRDKKKKIQARGDTEVTAADLEAMPFLQAVVKETLRMHPVAPHGFRYASKDDVLPLTNPIVTRSGKILTEVFISKGTRIMASIAAYNRCVISESWVTVIAIKCVHAATLTYGGPIHMRSTPIVGWMAV